MGRGSGASSLFSHRRFIHRFSADRLMIAALAGAACLIPAVLLAQQRRAPPASEPANVIRLRQQWFYQQRAYPHKADSSRGSE